MTTYLCRTKSGSTTHISAYTYSDAYQQATDWAGDGGLENIYAV
jgi:hypothetical protein